MSVDLAAAHVYDWMIASPPVITPRTSVSTALRLLREHALPALAVCEDGRVRGLVAEKALLRLTPSEATTLDVYELREALDRLTVASAALTPVAMTAPDAPVREAAELLVRTECDVVCVMEGDHPVGLLPWTAVLAGATGVENRRDAFAAGTPEVPTVGSANPKRGR